MTLSHMGSIPFKYFRSGICFSFFLAFMVLYILLCKYILTDLRDISPSQRQKTIREEHRSYYAISTTFVYGQEKYLLVSIRNP